MATLPGRWGAAGPALLAVLLAACEAGPSAWTRSPEAGVDTVLRAPPEGVAALPPVREGADVEMPPMAPVGVGRGPGADSTAGAPDRVPPPEPEIPPAAPEDAPRFPRPEHVRGLYVNAWAAGSARRLGELIDLARRTEINSFVIDIKDASGYVSHRTSVPLARESGATGEVRIRDLEGLLTTLETEGIYPIARIVMVKDPVLAAAHPELAVQDTAGGVWVDDKGIVWLNPYDHDVWDYHIALAREVAEFGFPEIQWDYVRFPDAPRSELERARYPGASGDRTRAETIRDFLLYSREALADVGVRVTTDVFGVTTSAFRDVGIGQVWEHFIDAVDVALPMVYPSHYWAGSWGMETPNAFPYEIVRHALEDAVARSDRVEGAGATRPWLQDFSLGEPPYGASEVRAQIQAAYDAGIEEWVLWNPSSRYTDAGIEPVGGFTREPTIRLAGRIVPVSRRFEVLDSVRLANEPPPDTLASPDSAAGAAEPDTARTLR